MVQKNKFEAYIGFSIKSGKTIFGYDKIVECKKKIAMIIFDESTNVKIVNKLISFCEFRNITLIKSNVLLKDLSKRDNVKTIGLLDNNFSKAILSNCFDEIVIFKEGENKIGK